MTSPTLDRRQGLVGNTPIKAPVACATTANITLSGEQVIDGVQTTSSRVLVLLQTDSTKNGIYDSSSAGWTRSADADGNYDLTTGTVVYVIAGTTNGNSFFQVSTASPITVGTSALSFVKSLFSSASVLSYIASGAGAVPRSVQDRLRDTISVKDYGAKGDGVTDDSAAFAALSAYVNAIALTAQPIQIEFPGGTYNYSSGLFFTRPVSLVSNQGALLNFSGAATAAIQLGPNNISGFNVFTQGEYSVDGLRFTGGAAALYGIYIASHVIEARIRNCTFIDYGQSTSHDIFAQDNNWDVIIENCRKFIMNSVTANGQFITINGVSTLSVPDGGNSRATIRDCWATAYNGTKFAYFAYVNGLKSRIIGGGFQNCLGIGLGPGATATLIDGVYNEQGGNSQNYITPFSSGVGATLTYPQQVVVRNGYLNFHASNGYTNGRLIAPGDASVLLKQWIVEDMTITDYTTNQPLIVQNDTTGQNGNRYGRVTKLFIPNATDTGNVFLIRGAYSNAESWASLDVLTGTWTPSVGGSATYTSQVGEYTLVGDTVTVTFDIQINVIGSGSTSSISGLPIAAGPKAAGGSVGFFSGLALSVTSLNLRIDGGNSSITVTGLTAAAAATPGTLAALGSGARIIGSVTYQRA